MKKHKQNISFSELKEKLRNIPAQPGCYLWYGRVSPDTKEEILYIGKAVKLQHRLRSYLSSDDTKTRFLMGKVSGVDWLVTDNEVEALLLESNLIKKHNPVYNIRLKDDKRYPYLCLTLGEDFPRLIITRKKQNSKHSYFGPFTDVSAARNTMTLVHKVFPIRKRNIKLPLSKPTRPCLNYFIQRCLAPCAHYINKEDYRNMVQNVQAFLEGNDTQLQKKLTEEMQQFSQKMQYEQAGKIKKMLEDIAVLRNEQKVHSESPQTNYDIVGLFVADYQSLHQDLEMESDYLDYTSADNSDYIGQIVLLQVRNGNLISKKSYAMSEYGQSQNSEQAAEKDMAYMQEHALDISSEFLNAFFRDYYLEVADIPARIVVSHNSLELARWQNILQHKMASGTIEILSPEQAKHMEKEEVSFSLIETAETNARLTLRERILNEKLRNQKLALRQIQNLLSLSVVPKTIECYDISNTQGTNAVGSGVMLKDGLPFKSGYRRYKIKNFTSPDDPGMMNEVLTRRLTAIAQKREDKPDLIVIDGGITQLHAGIKAKQQTGVEVPMIGLAKKEEELYLETGEILDPDSESPAMLLLRLARDEAHRFGVNYHRHLRSKKFLQE